MSLSLLGIILVQLYWVNTSLKKNDEQFKFHIQQVLARVATQMQRLEAEEFYKVYLKYKDSTGTVPTRNDMIRLYDMQAMGQSSRPIIYSHQVTREFDDAFFDKEKFDAYVTKKASAPAADSLVLKNEPETDVERVLSFQNDVFLKDFRRHTDLESWLTKDKLRDIIGGELKQNGVDTPFEFGVFNEGIPTKINSGNLHSEPKLIDHKLFDEGGDYNGYRLFIGFPKKQQYLVSSIFGITMLSIVFTLIIIIAYLSAINQLIKQKNISEIKTDFINNMTHEFKTPIATINLALDAIKNPKIFNDKERVQYYLQMIREENKRMHSQVENVLQISRLDKKELDIAKEAADVNDILEHAVEHVRLIIEARQGMLTRHFAAARTTALLNDVHFTNVIVNILDNAIKYSPDEPVIDIYTENVKDFILIKIRDHGLGMAKNTQKRIFEKFYREHTGDRHDVKGHGLGLAYVKRIIDDHNCHIYVESEKGKGSTFIIKMPLIN